MQPTGGTLTLSTLSDLQNRSLAGFVASFVASSVQDKSHISLTRFRVSVC